jgi:hypothetical protein
MQAARARTIPAAALQQQQEAVVVVVVVLVVHLGHRLQREGSVEGVG